MSEFIAELRQSVRSLPNSGQHNDKPTTWRCVSYAFELSCQHDHINLFMIFFMLYENIGWTVADQKLTTCILIPYEQHPG